MNDVNKALSKEIASRKRAEYTMFDMMSHLPNPDPILKRMGKDITVYRDLLSDAQIGGNTRRRRSAVLSLENELVQGDASNRVYELCQLTLRQLNRMSNKNQYSTLKQLITGLHDACWYGYAPAEIYYESQNGLWLPSKVVAKPQEWFAFDEDNRLCFLEAGRVVGEPVPDNKFILATQDATFANPYDMGDLSKVYWHERFKKGGLKFWLRFCDKYGQAFLIGKHPRGTQKKERDLILDSLGQLEQDSVGTFPDDASVEIMESGGKSASADLYERLLTYCKGEINTALLGQNQSTEMSATHASAKAGNEVVDDIRDADADFVITPAINALLEIVVRLNIGDNEVMPEWRMFEQEDKTEQLAERDEKLAKAGAKFTKQHFVKTYDLDEDQIADDVATDTGTQTSFSEFRPLDKDYANETQDQLAKLAAPEVQGWIDQIKDMLAKAPSLEAFRDDVLTAFGNLDQTKLVKVMELAFTAAELAGMAEVVEETANE